MYARHRKGYLAVAAVFAAVCLFLCFPAREIRAACQITTSPGAVSFIIDPSLPGPILGTITTQVSIRCRLVAFTVVATSLNGGASFVMKKGTDTINYNFTYVTSGPWTFAWTTYNLILGSSVNKVYYENAPVGSGYSDRITLTVTF